MFAVWVQCRFLPILVDQQVSEAAFLDLMIIHLVYTLGIKHTVDKSVDNWNIQ